MPTSCEQECDWAGPAACTRTTCKRRVYISGPMTGLPEMNFPAFFEAEKKVHGAGYYTENPARLPKPNPVTWEEYMRMCLVQISRCAIVAVLPNWEQSRGATIEVDIAKKLGMRVVTVEELVNE